MKKRMLISILLLIFGVVSAYSVENEDKVDKSNYFKVKGVAYSAMFRFTLDFYSDDDEASTYVMFEKGDKKEVLNFRQLTEHLVTIAKDEEVTIYGIYHSLVISLHVIDYCELDFTHFTQLCNLDLRRLKVKDLSLSNISNLKKIYLNDVEPERISISNCENLDFLEINNSRYYPIPCRSANFSGLKSMKYLYLHKYNIDTLRLINMPLIGDFLYREKNLRHFEYKGDGGLFLLTLDGNKLEECIIEGKTNLEHLYLHKNKLRKLVLDPGGNFKKLELNDNKIEQLDLSKVPSLTYLNLDNNSLKSIDLSNNKQLNELYLSNNPDLTELDVSKCEYISKLTLEGNLKISKLNVSRCKYLGSLKINGLNNIKELKLDSCYSLCSLNVDNCILEELDFSASKNLKFVSAKNNKLKKVNLGKSKVLETLNLKGNELTDININNSGILTYVDLSDNKLSSLNVDNLTYLRVLKIQGNRFSVQAYDDLYCQLRYDPSFQNNYWPPCSLFLLNNNDDSNAHIVFQSNPKNITKNLWTINYSVLGNEYSNRVFIPDSLFKGTYMCSYSNINLNNQIVIKGHIGDTTYIAIKPTDDNTDIKIQVGSQEQRYKLNNKWNKYNIVFSDSLATIYGDIAVMNFLLDEPWREENKLGIIGLDLSNHSAIKELYCSNKKIKKLSVLNAKNLSILLAANNKIKELDLSTNKSLIEVNVSKNIIKKLDLSNNKNLRFLECSSNPLRDLNIKGDYSLTYIDIADTRFTAEQLDELYCDVYGKFGRIYACNGFDDINYPNVMESSSQILTDKKWWLMNNANLSIMKTNGTNTCAESKPLINRYPVFVAGILVNDANKDDIKAPGIEGKVSYDPETNTLRMENATISEAFIHEYSITTWIPPLNETKHYRYHYTVRDSSDRDFTVELVGDNKIVINNDWDRWYTGIFPISAKKNLTIKGGGRLRFVTKDAYYPDFFAGIFSDKNVTIDSCDINFNSNVYLHAVYFGDSLIFKNNAKLRANTLVAALLSRNNGSDNMKLYPGAVLFEGLNEENCKAVGKLTFYSQYPHHSYYSNRYIAIVPGWASVQESDDVESATLFLYPNPASDFIDVNVKAEDIGKELILFNILGEAKYRTVLYTNELRIPLEALSKGVYIIQIGDERKKVMINK